MAKIPFLDGPEAGRSLLGVLGRFMADISMTLLVLKTHQVEQVRIFHQALGIELVEEQHRNEPARRHAQGDHRHA